MTRAKYQVLVLPYIREGDEIIYCIFKKIRPDVWQFISGGGEDEDESVLHSAKREAFEEAGIGFEEKYSSLETLCSIPTKNFRHAREIWGEKCLVIPEYFFAVELTSRKIVLSEEHSEYLWTNYETAESMLSFDSNKTALWELDNKIKMGLL